MTGATIGSKLDTVKSFRSRQREPEVGRRMVGETKLPRGLQRASRHSDTYHHGALREALLEATEAVLLEHGVEGFTLRECARRAGVSHGAPAHHFGDARGLLSEFTAVSFERLDALMGDYRRRAGADGFEQFSVTGLAYVDFALANRARFQLMFRSDRLDFGHARLTTAAGRVYNHLVETVTALRPSRDRGETQRECIALAWSLAHGLATLMLDNRAFAQLVGDSPRHAHRMMENLLARARPLFASTDAPRTVRRARQPRERRLSAPPGRGSSSG